ncbi:MAG: flavodoxin-dependent (E)-4-hydroxy-3-methylbut-2-enyl-diphosphate synthase [Armatimonadia bacterium]|nr:flavodoxin-dependent (E)-4-hydroxy-3-methylbut-2-enyl-diphosphate synthase [Armatimonadia bacterium]
MLPRPPRRQSRRVGVGSVPVGGGAPIAVQTMCNTPTEDPEATLAQIERVAGAGCEIVRVAVPDHRSARAFGEIVEHSPIPVVADIQFSAELAVKTVEAGAAKVRINPGNIGGPEKVRRVADAALAARVPIRVGVNSGSVGQEVRERHGGVTPEALVESALAETRLLEEYGVEDMVVAIKASDAARTIASCRLLAESCDYPIHLGVTEAGPPRTGTVKSAYALGTLLSEGIGDTIRVSLTTDPEEEVRTAWDILAAVGVRVRGPQIVSCPTCSRCHIDMILLTEMVEKALRDVSVPMTVAVMGCIVNGPGEARDADVAICAEKGGGVITRRGQVIKKVGQGELLPALMEEVRAVERELQGTEGARA